MKLGVLLLCLNFLFAFDYTAKEKTFLKNNPVVYFACMKYWPVDKSGNSIHTNFIKLLNKYGGLNIVPVYYKYWSDAFEDAKTGKVHGILGISRSLKREKDFLFTKAYNFAPYYIIVNENSDIRNLKDLKNKKVFIAKKSILRDILKNSGFEITYTRHPYTDLLNGKIDAVAVFYVPDISYMEKFKVITTFIDRYGEEHIGVNKKYETLYKIINKAVEEIPYGEIEKIRKKEYQKKLPPGFLLSDRDFSLKYFITTRDLMLIFLLSAGLITVLFLFLSGKFLNMRIKKFIFITLVFEATVMFFLISEMLIYHYYSNKIYTVTRNKLQAVYVTDMIENKIFELMFNLKSKHIKKYFLGGVDIKNLKLDGKKLGYYLNMDVFTPNELDVLGNVLNNVNKILKKKKIEKLKINTEYVMEQFNIIKDLIKQRNRDEISVIEKKLRFQSFLLILSFVVYLIISLFIVYMIFKKVDKPLENLYRLVLDFGKNVKTGGKVFYKDEIGAVSEKLFYLHKQLENKIKELQRHKEDLKIKIQNEVEKRLRQEEILSRQSKFALMGEMIDAIAHQWKSPVNNIKFMIEVLKYEKNELTEEKLDEFIRNSEIQINHLLETINSFREFFNNQKKEEFEIYDVIDDVLLLLKDELMRESISVRRKITTTFKLYGVKSDFEHLLISIILNAKDIFNERGIKRKEIIIRTYEDEENYYIELEDTAGGIKEEIMDKVFDLHFSTRKGGTGLGLYLASQIALKHGGVLKVSNGKYGAVFSFVKKK
ncbi:ATP-binding protein [Nautilia sp.]